MRSSEEQSLLFLETGLILAMSWPISHPGNLPLPPPQSCRGPGFDFHLLLTEGILMCSPEQENSAPS